MNVKYEFIEGKEFSPFFKENRSKIFQEDFDFDIDKLLSSKEKEDQLKHFDHLKNIDRYYLAAKVDDKIIAWSFGMQKSNDDFYMVNSAVFPEFRRQKIYSELMRLSVLKIEEMGYQRIYSLHKMGNNPVLIAKLKFGFKITGFQLTDNFGNLLELSYYTNEKRRELLDVRMGLKKMDEEIMKLNL